MILLPEGLQSPSTFYHLSRPLSKSTLPATVEAPLEKSGQRISKSVTTVRAPQNLGLHVISQHQFLGVWMEVHLLVYPTLRWAPQQGTGTGKHPLGHRVAAQVMLQQREGHDQRQ